MKASLRVNNNKTQLITDLKTLTSIRDDKTFKLKVKGAFFSPAFRSRRWDGYKRFISESGYFDTGLITKVYTWLRNAGAIIKIEDERNHIRTYTIPNKLGKQRPLEWQDRSVEALRDCYVGGIKLNRGIINAATNAGKNMIMAMIYRMYELPTIILLNRKEYFEETLELIPKLLPGKVGFIKADEEKWNEVMICMVPTLNKRINQYKSRLSKFRICLVDEADLGVSKSYQTVLKNLINSDVRVGLTGTAFLHKDPIKNMLLYGFFGEELIKIGNKELQAKGQSSKVDITFLLGNDNVKIPGSYEDEYTHGIIKNKTRNMRIIRRVKFHLNKKRLPILIICKRHKHVKKLYKYCLKYLDPIYVVDWVHHSRSDRQDVIKRFKSGDIDILVGSEILQRAKNFPEMQVLINGKGGDSISAFLQLFGRITRKSKLIKIKKKFFDDFFDKGAYLQRHSKHRIKGLKDDGHTINEKYKKHKNFANKL